MSFRDPGMTVYRRSLKVMIREANTELAQLGDKHEAYETLHAVIAGSDAFRPVGWTALKLRARVCTEALQKENELDAQVAFRLLLDRLDEADKPYASRGMSADIIILEERAHLHPFMMSATDSFTTAPSIDAMD